MKAKPTNHPGEVVLELNRRDEALLAATGGQVTPSPFRLKSSVAENVVRHAPCPVLVVREREHEFLAN